MGVLIGQVGHQPGAVATVGRTLALNHRIKRVILLVSSGPRGTVKAGERLSDYFTSIGLSVQVLTVNHAKDPQAFADGILSMGSDPKEEIFFNVAAGPSYFVADVSRRLRGCPCLFPMFAEYGFLEFLAPDRQGRFYKYRLADIGIDELLKLHELQLEYTGNCGSDRQDLVFKNAGNHVFTALAAYERGGKLFCLTPVLHDKNEARRLISLRKWPDCLNGLRPNFTACSLTPWVVDRLNTAGFDVIRTGEPDIGRWKRNGTPDPGSFASDADDKPVSVDPIPGQGGDGPPLAVCLGNDPSSTLVSVYSHSPSTCWVLYDKSTSQVRAAAFRLASVADRLPVGELRFREVSLSGQSLDLDAIVEHETAGAKVVANVTPGSKGQSWAFGQSASSVLCSIENRSKEIKCIGEAAEFDAIPKILPPTYIQATVAGGRELGVRLDDAKVGKRQDFLAGIAYCFQVFAPPNDYFSLRREARSKLHGADVSIDYCWAKGAFGVSLHRYGITMKGDLSAPLNENGSVHGMWLEEVAAGAFRAAGATDVLVGVTWPWDPEKLRPDKPRMEIDVLFNWMGNFAAVSVKAYQVKNQEKLDEFRTEIAAMAMEGMGRFCLPVLVHYLTNETAITARSLEVLETEGVLDLGVCQLGDPVALAALLEDAFKLLRKSEPGQ